MPIDYAIIAKHVEQLRDGTWLLVGAESGLRGSAQFPAMVPVVLFVSLTIPVYEAAGEQEFTVDILGPDLQTVDEPLTLGFHAGPGPNTPPGWAFACSNRCI